MVAVAVAVVPAQYGGGTCATYGIMYDREHWKQKYCSAKCYAKEMGRRQMTRLQVVVGCRSNWT